MGLEAIAPPTVQDSFAVFALEKIELDRFRVQFGGRVEHNAYTPVGLQNRSFTGISASAGDRARSEGHLLAAFFLKTISQSNRFHASKVLRPQRLKPLNRDPLYGTADSPRRTCPDENSPQILCDDFQ